MRLSRRDKHHIMKAVAGEPGMAMGKELTRPNGDCRVDKVNSVAEGRDEHIEPISQSADARLLARRNWRCHVIEATTRSGIAVRKFKRPRRPGATWSSPRREARGAFELI